MKKSFLISALTLSLTACASTMPTYGNQLTWRPRNFDGPAYIILGRLDTNVWTGAQTIHLSIDGEEVIVGPLSPYNKSGSFVGKYKKHKVSIDCKKVSYEILCDVFMDNEKAGTF